MLEAAYQILFSFPVNLTYICEKKLAQVITVVFGSFKVTSHAESLKKMAVALAELDVSSSLAVLALKRGYVKPIIGNQNEFLVKGGRHPVVDVLQPNSFVCNDCDLSEKNLWIITGPNMGGKCRFISNHFFSVRYPLYLSGETNPSYLDKGYFPLETFNS